MQDKKHYDRHGRRRRNPPSKHHLPISHLNDKLEIYTPEPEDDYASDRESAGHGFCSFTEFVRGPQLASCLRDTSVSFGLVGLKAAELHGNLLQGERLHALELFRKQEVDFLIATELVVLGIDKPVAQAVINYDCPSQLTSYVHRVSRTARAGREGHAVTFVTDNDRSCLKAIQRASTEKSQSGSNEGSSAEVGHIYMSA